MALEPRARVGEVLDAKYCIEEFLGGGAMGSVFRARHVGFGRDFAIKMLHERLRGDPKIAARFSREAELAAKLKHPHVIGVIDVCEDGDDTYMVMEFAPGRPLAELIRASAPYLRERAIAMIRQLLAGLEHAHALGLVHRDLKPDNVIVEHTGDREHARIVDFGIAILRESAEASSRDSANRITTDGLVLGTPQYMAPELATGRPFDHRADLFALGVICFEMLTGRMPFDGTGVDVALANVGTNTPPMGVRVPTVQVDPLLELFTRRLMMKKPEDRFPNAAAAIAILDLIERDPKAAARALSPSTPLLSTGSGAHSTSAKAIGTSPPWPGTLRTEQREAIGSAETQAIAAVERPEVRTRSRLLVYGGIAVGAVVIAAVTLAGSWQPRHSSPTASPAQSIDAPAPIAASTPAPAPIVEQAPAQPAVKAPTAVELAPAPPAAKPRVPGKHQVTKAERPAPAATAPHEITAKEVASLYGTVGRKLKALADRPGVDALWARYRTIRIDTVLATAADRERTNRFLAAILADANAI